MMDRKADGWVDLVDCVDGLVLRSVLPPLVFVLLVLPAPVAGADICEGRRE